MNLKRRLQNLTSDKKQLQKRSLRARKSFDEVSRLLNSTKVKRR